MLKVKKYRKKPVEIEAVQLKENNILEVVRFIEGKDIQLNTDTLIEKFEAYEDTVREKGIKIETLEGNMVASLGDYIIKGVQGEFYPCKPDIFEMTYESVR